MDLGLGELDMRETEGAPSCKVRAVESNRNGSAMLEAVAKLTLSSAPGMRAMRKGFSRSRQEQQMTDDHVLNLPLSRHLLINYQMPALLQQAALRGIRVPSNGSRAAVVFAIMRDRSS